MRITTLLLSFALLTTTAVPQQSVPPAPKTPADKAPSLQVTMKFIQDTLNAVGNVNYAVRWLDDTDNTNGTVRASLEASNVVADPASCWIRYHLKIVEGTSLNDRDSGFFLPDVEDLVVKTGKQYVDKHYADNGYPTIYSKIDPPIFWVVAQRPEDRSGLSVWRRAGEDAFVFTDEETANRVAKAMRHAVELCDEGQKGK